MKIRHLVPLAALLLVAACGHSSEAASQNAASPSSDAASTADSSAAAPDSLEGIKRRVPVYSSNLTSAPELISTGVYQFQTKDSVPAVLAWYKAHIPGDLGGAWSSSPGPADEPDWYYDGAHPVGGGKFAIGMQHPRRDVGNQYAPGTNTVVEVTDQ